MFNGYRRVVEVGLREHVQVGGNHLEGDLEHLSAKGAIGVELILQVYGVVCYTTLTDEIVDGVAV